MSFVWYHVVDLYDGNTQKLYLNGVLKASRTPTGKNTVRTNFFIGHLQFNKNNWEGYIDDLRIYNRALTVAEAQFLYNSEIMPTTKKPSKRKQIKDFLFIDL